MSEQDERFERQLSAAMLGRPIPRGPAELADLAMKRARAASALAGRVARARWRAGLATVLAGLLLALVAVGTVQRLDALSPQAAEAVEAADDTLEPGETLTEIDLAGLAAGVLVAVAVLWAASRHVQAGSGNMVQFYCHIPRQMVS